MNAIVFSWSLLIEYSFYDAICYMLMLLFSQKNYNYEEHVASIY